MPADGLERSSVEERKGAIKRSGAPKFLNRNPRASSLVQQALRWYRQTWRGWRLFPLRAPARSLPIVAHHGLRQLRTIPGVELASAFDFALRARLTERKFAFGLGLRKEKAMVGQVAFGDRASFALLRVSSQRGKWMRIPAIKSLEGLTLEEALAYLDAADGDELAAAYALALDRNHLDGSTGEPDDAEVHHALFLLRSARGLDAPSFDLMRVQLRRRVAA
jgi:hypothetical protein